MLHRGKAVEHKTTQETCTNLQRSKKRFKKREEFHFKQFYKQQINTIYSISVNIPAKNSFSVSPTHTNIIVFIYLTQLPQYLKVTHCCHSLGDCTFNYWASAADLLTISPREDLSFQWQCQCVSIRAFGGGDFLHSMLGLKHQLHGEGLVVGITQPQTPVAPLSTSTDWWVIMNEEGAELARLNLKCVRLQIWNRTDVALKIPPLRPWLPITWICGNKLYFQVFSLTVTENAQLNCSNQIYY